MKLKKLNARGFSHDLFIVAFVAVFAIAGVGYLVSSHADSCPPVSGPVTVKPFFNQTTGGVALCTSTVKCSISGVPANPKVNQVLQPKLVLTNNSNNTAKVSFTTYVISYGTGQSGRTRSLSTTRHTITLAAHHSTSQQLPHYKVPYATSAIDHVNYQTVVTKPASPGCGATAKLPTRTPANTKSDGASVGSEN